MALIACSLIDTCIYILNAFDDSLLYTSVKAGNYDQFSGIKL